MKDIRERILAAFRVEYKEHLEFIRSELTRFESGETESARRRLDETFRRAHSLKGAARAADLRPVETLAHRMETLFSRVRAKTLELNKPVIDVLNGAADAIEDWVVSFDKDEDPADPVEELRAIEDLLGLESQDSAPTRKKPGPASGKTAPARKKSKPAPKQAAAPPEADEETVRVRTTNLDRLLRSAGQLLTENVRQKTVTRALRSVERTLHDLELEWKRLGLKYAPVPHGAGGGTASGAVVHHMDSIERHIRWLNKEIGSARSMQQRSAWMLHQLGNELQYGIRLARMVPAENVFGGFRMMMRDLARDEGKEIEFRIIGMDVKADRMVLQTLKDPVMHMLRNSVSHGIEPARERVAKKKDAAGRVTLTFEVEGGRLAVSVDDDGRGIDLKKVAESGIREGLLTEAEAAAATSWEMVQQIFKPGVSTSHAVTDLAGRGMGLSIVHEAAARLNGSLEVLKKDVPGAAFRLLVPLSISTHRLLMVGCRDQIFGIPTDGIERLNRINVKDIKSVEGKSVVKVQGRQLPLLSLAVLLGLDSFEVSVQEGIVPVLILRSGETKVAVAIDSLISIRDAVIRDLGFPIARGSLVAGGIIREDGSISPVLSTFSLVESFRSRGAPGELATAERTPVEEPPIILVVDDSITTRTLEKSILEAHGYRVRIAVDGLEALTRLRSEPVDLVIADVQMPRLDGFGLLAEMKKDMALATIPVIMVTSMSSREDRERGLSLGADAYVVKQKFDQRDLLETIGQML